MSPYEGMRRPERAGLLLGPSVPRLGWGKPADRDTIATRKDVYLLRTTADIPLLGEAFLNQYRQERAKSGITTFALTPDTAKARHLLESGKDEEMKFKRVSLPKNSYTAPVEVDVYGDKTAIIAFGETQIATIIDSPPIAQAMRQILGLLRSALANDIFSPTANTAKPQSGPCAPP